MIYCALVFLSLGALLVCPCFEALQRLCGTAPFAGGYVGQAYNGWKPGGLAKRWPQCATGVGKAEATTLVASGSWRWTLLSLEHLLVRRGSASVDICGSVEETLCIEANRQCCTLGAVLFINAELSLSE